jgi:hypothetical protein
MERVMMMAKRRDEMPVIGTSKAQPTSLLSFSHDQIIEHASSLGKSNSENIATVKLIMDIEQGHTLTMLEKKKIKWSMIMNWLHHAW